MHTQHTHRMKIPEIKISYSHRVPLSELPRIQSSNDAYKVAYDLFDHDEIGYRESSYIIVLNTWGRVLGAALIGVGSSTACVLDVKQCLQVALKANANNVIIVHNHPSGNTEPSSNDKTIMKQMESAFDLLNIDVLDGIIVTPERGRYYSFKDNE